MASVSEEEAKAINANMIFFKSLAEVKKRREELKVKMHPKNFSHVTSKVSTRRGGESGRQSEQTSRMMMRSCMSHPNIIDVQMSPPSKQAGPKEIKQEQRQSMRPTMASSTLNGAKSPPPKDQNFLGT